jgi:glucose-1-phosphate thymidylyltransferase
MKGVILAGGAGTRLYPATTAISKQLLPVYDKPMVYYPLSILMLAGIRDILLVSTEEHLPLYRGLFGDGSRLGLRMSYVVQEKPRGIAEAFILGRDFIGGENCCLVLGDNIFFGHGLGDLLRRARARKSGATIFSYWVHDPQRYGVIAFDPEGNPVSIVEKPRQPQSHWAMTGLYFFDNRVVEIARGIRPSGRGELEITDVVGSYLAAGDLTVERMGRGHAWLDTGTHDSLLEASNFIRTVERRQHLKVACLEEIAMRQKFITRDDLRAMVQKMQDNEYTAYLRDILDFPD